MKRRQFLLLLVRILGDGESQSVPLSPCQIISIITEIVLLQPGCQGWTCRNISSFSLRPGGEEWIRLSCSLKGEIFIMATSNQDGNHAARLLSFYTLLEMFSFGPLCSVYSAAFSQGVSTPPSLLQTKFTSAGVASLQSNHRSPPGKITH